MGSSQSTGVLKKECPTNLHKTRSRHQAKQSIDTNSYQAVSQHNNKTNQYQQVSTINTSLSKLETLYKMTSSLVKDSSESLPEPQIFFFDELTLSDSDLPLGMASHWARSPRAYSYDITRSRRAESCTLTYTLVHQGSSCSSPYAPTSCNESNGYSPPPTYTPPSCKKDPRTPPANFDYLLQSAPLEFEIPYPTTCGEDFPASPFSVSTGSFVFMFGTEALQFRPEATSTPRFENNSPSS